MSYKLRKQTPGYLLGQIYEYQLIHGSKLFEQRLYETRQQNSKVMQVRNRHYYEIYTSIQTWPIQQFTAPETLEECTWLLRAISGIDFCNLTILNLEYVGLQTSEPLSWLNAPQLTVLLLNRNNFHSYKSLAKSHFHHLEQLSLRNNPITESRKVTEPLHLARMNLRLIKKLELGHPIKQWINRFQNMIFFSDLNQLHETNYQSRYDLFCIIKISGPKFNRHQVITDRKDQQYPHLLIIA